MIRLHLHIGAVALMGVPSLPDDCSVVKAHDVYTRYDEDLLNNHFLPSLGCSLTELLLEPVMANVFGLIELVVMASPLDS